MTSDIDDPTERQRSTDEHVLSRRQALTLGGVGAGLLSLGAIGTVYGQEDDESSEADDGDDSPDDSFVADLVDPTFGYPMAADETAALSLEHVVGVLTAEGEGSHAGFPSDPDDDAPGSSAEIPAEFLFDPVGLQVEPGDVVHFLNENGLHTVSAFHEKFEEPELDIPNRVPEGVPGFTSPPLTTGESWAYQFVEPGVYDLFCFPHLSLGMVMRIVVFDPEVDSLDDEAFEAPDTGGLFPNDEAVLEADELDPAAIVEEGEVAWADLSLSPPETGDEEEEEEEEETETEEEDEEETETQEEEETETATETETETEEEETETATETETETQTETETGTETGTETETPAETETGTPTET